MSVQDRVKRYKSTGGGVGLVRVEVLVPPEDREEILKLAADLRRQRREKSSNIALKPVVNRESVNDRAKLILHRLVARRLRANPLLLDEARTRLQSVERPPPGLCDPVDAGARTAR